MMSEYATREEILAAIEPRSDQLNADDLVTGPITVTITKVRSGDREQPIIVEIEGHRPFKPCKTMLRVLSSVFTEDGKNWVGEQMTLYCDPSVTMGGVKVGGVRISHLSTLSQPKTFIVTLRRGKRIEVTVYPIVKLSPEDQKFISEATAELAAVESLDVLNGYGQTLKTKSKTVQDALRPVYVKRLDELKAKEALG